MAEEEKKPEFVLNKREKKAESQPKQNDAQPKTTDEKQPKKRILKRKSPSHLAAASSDAQSSSSVSQNKISESESKIQEKEMTKVQSPVEKKPSVSSASAAAPASSSENSSPSPTPAVAKTVSQSGVNAKTEQNVSDKGSPRSENKTFELKTARPNVRAGNLNPSNRTNGYNNRGSYNRNNGGFTGTQARQGYQNRERQGNFNSNGENRGNGYGNRGYSNNGYNNRGNFNRDGQNTQQGGFNRGGYNNRGNFNAARPGTNPKPGFGGGARPLVILLLLAETKLRQKNSSRVKNRIIPAETKKTCLMKRNFIKRSGR